MYCRNCSLQYPNGTMFCSNCGSALEKLIAEQPIDEPVQDYSFAEQPMDDSFAQIDPQYVVKKPKNVKKIVAVVVSVVGVLALVAGLLYYLLVYNHPVNKLKRAMDNTLEQLMVNTPTLSNVYENLRELTNEREYSAKIDYVYSEDWADGDSERNSCRIELNYDADGEEMSGKADISTYSNWWDEVYSNSYNLEFSADDENIYASCKQLGREVYSLPLEDFGEKYQDSALADMVGNDDLNDFLEKAEIDPYADFSFTTFCTETDEGKDFIESLELEKTDDKIPHTKDLTVYRLQLEVDELMDAMSAYSMFMVTRLFGEEAADELDEPGSIEVGETLIFYLGINDDDCLVAIYAYPKGDKDDAILISLEGEENIWDKIACYVGDEKHELFIEQKKDGFELYRKYDNRSPEKLFECDDGECELIIYDGNEREYVLEYSDEDDGATFKLDYQYTDEDGYSYYDYYSKTSVELEFSILPPEDIEMIDDDPIEVLELSKRKLEDLLEELEEVFD